MLYTIMPVSKYWNAIIISVLERRSRNYHRTSVINESDNTYPYFITRISNAETAIYMTHVEVRNLITRDIVQDVYILINNERDN